MEQQQGSRATRATGTLGAAALLVVVVAVGATGCSAPRAGGPGAARIVPTTATTATTTATATTATTATATTAAKTTATASSAAVPSPAPSRGTRPVPLPLTDAVRAQLVAAYAAANGYQASWVAGLRPGTSYYVVEPATGVQLAWVTFQASATAPERVQVGLQDEGSRTALRRAPGGAWTVDDICRTPDLLALVGGVLPAGGRCPTP